MFNLSGTVIFSEQPVQHQQQVGLPFQPGNKCMGEGFQDYTIIQNFEADFPGLRVCNEKSIFLIS